MCSCGAPGQRDKIGVRIVATGICFGLYTHSCCCQQSKNDFGMLVYHIGKEVNPRLHLLVLATNNSPNSSSGTTTTSTNEPCPSDVYRAASQQAAVQIYSFGSARFLDHRCRPTWFEVLVSTTDSGDPVVFSLSFLFIWSLGLSWLGIVLMYGYSRLLSTKYCSTRTS